MIRVKQIKQIAMSKRRAKISQKAAQLLKAIFAQRFFPKLKKEILNIKQDQEKITPNIVARAYEQFEPLPTQREKQECAIPDIRPDWAIGMQKSLGYACNDDCIIYLQQLTLIWFSEMIRKALIFVHNRKRVVIQERDVTMAWMVCDKTNKNVPERLVTQKKRRRPRKKQAPRKKPKRKKKKETSPMISTEATISEDEGSIEY